MSDFHDSGLTFEIFVVLLAKSHILAKNYLATSKLAIFELIGDLAVASLDRQFAKLALFVAFCDYLAIISLYYNILIRNGDVLNSGDMIGDLAVTS